MRPTVKLRHDAHPRTRYGHPWLYSNELEMTAEAKAIAPGTVVRVVDARGSAVGCGTFNPHSLIAVRTLDTTADLAIDREFLAHRLRRAATIRDRWFGAPFYRLAHSEGDRLPGFVIDRFGDVFTVQANTAGAERLTPDLLDAIEEIFTPRAIVLRNDTPARGLEGLPLVTEVARGAIEGPVRLVENGATFEVDLVGGQKTGWFYDHRLNRADVARLCDGVDRALDVYTYAGGFAVQMALGGAKHVTAVDRSEGSLALADRSVALNGLEGRVTTRRGEAFEVMDQLAASGERFDVVVVDPPAFAKNKADAGAAARGYRKMARQAAVLVAPGGILFAASCSHHMERERFEQEVLLGVASAGRQARVLRTGGAGPDHPVHPQLPQTSYLKSMLLALD